MIEHQVSAAPGELPGRLREVLLLGDDDGVGAGPLKETSSPWLLGADRPSWDRSAHLLEGIFAKWAFL